MSLRNTCLASTATLATLFAPIAASADTLDVREARAQLYRADRVEVVRYDMRGLSEQEQQVLTTVAQSQKYYAAVAFAPDAGIMAEPTVMSANYHNIDAARDAALSGCNERRSGGARCVVALEVRPAGWEARDLQMSADATEAFNDDFRRARGARVFAISASSGQWGIGRGDAAEADAMSACTGDSGVGDCSPVIVED